MTVRKLAHRQSVHQQPVAEALAAQATDAAYTDVVALFGAMADPTRIRLIHMLMQQEMCTCDLAEALGISESGVSQHLRLLRRLHLVKSRRAGKFVHYTLDDAHVALLMQIGLTHTGHGDAHLPDVLAALDGAAGYVAVPAKE